MAIQKKKLVAMIIGLGLAFVAGCATLLALEGDLKNDDEIAHNDYIVADNTASGDSNGSSLVRPNSANASTGDAINLDFILGAFENLEDVPLSKLVEKIESVTGVAEETKVWVATANVASTPGSETLFHVKGPLTCGSVGCELIVVGDWGGTQKILLETVGERVDAPEIDTLIVNQDTVSEVVWKFNGEKFVKN